MMYTLYHPALPDLIERTIRLGDLTAEAHAYLSIYIVQNDKIWQQQMQQQYEQDGKALNVHLQRPSS